MICSARSDISDINTDFETAPPYKCADNTRQLQFGIQRLMDMQKEMDDRLSKLERTHNDEVAHIRAQMSQIENQLQQITYQSQ